MRNADANDATSTDTVSHDMFTVNEVFCREDYACGPETRTVVDVG